MKNVRRTAQPEPPARTEFLARSDVSKMLGVSPNTVTRWAREGRLPCHVTLGGHHRFERTLVEQPAATSFAHRLPHPSHP
ncbi:MAG: helix-turn-helix domain-containing protein [Vicinamibacteria bacterium]